MPVAGGTVTVVCDATSSTTEARGPIAMTSCSSPPARPKEPRRRCGACPPPAASGGWSSMCLCRIPTRCRAAGSSSRSTNNPTARTASELNIVSIDVDTGDVRPLIAGGTYPRYAATGHVVFLRNGTLMATAIDVAARTVSDQSQVVVQDVFMNPAMASGNFAVSAAGTLAYAPGTAADFQSRPVPDRREGRALPVTDERRTSSGRAHLPTASGLPSRFQDGVTRSGCSTAAAAR